MADRELKFDPGWDEPYEWAQDILNAIDLASDQDKMTWLTADGKRVAAIVPVDVAEAAEQAAAEQAVADLLAGKSQPSACQLSWHDGRHTWEEHDGYPRHQHSVNGQLTIAPNDPSLHFAWGPPFDGEQSQRGRRHDA